MTGADDARGPLCYSNLLAAGVSLTCVEDPSNELREVIADRLRQTLTSPVARTVIDILIEAGEWLSRPEIAKRIGRSKSAVHHAVERLVELGIAHVDEWDSTEKWRPAYLALSPALQAVLEKRSPMRPYMTKEERIERDLRVWRLLPDDDVVVLDDLREQAQQVIAADQVEDAVRSLRKHDVIHVLAGMTYTPYDLEWRAKAALQRDPRKERLDALLAPPSWQDVEAEVQRRLPAAVQAELERRADLQLADEILSSYTAWRDEASAPRTT